MTNYNDGKWHGWNGGECPVHPETVVEVVFEDGWKDANSKAHQWTWDHNGYSIIAFRVVKEHKEPREFWVWEDVSGTVHISRKPIPASFKVREVLE